MHLRPAQGQPRDVGTPIVEMLYPERRPVAHPDHRRHRHQRQDHRHPADQPYVRDGPLVVGMTCTEGTYIDGERIIDGDCSGPRSAKAVLLHPRVEVAVLETARGGILREGLGFDAAASGW